MIKNKNTNLKKENDFKVIVISEKNAKLPTGEFIIKLIAYIATIFIFIYFLILLSYERPCLLNKICSFFVGASNTVFIVLLIEMITIQVKKN